MAKIADAPWARPYHSVNHLNVQGMAKIADAPWARPYHTNA